MKRRYWHSTLREKMLGAVQAASHRRLARDGGKRYVIFLVPGADFVNGGILSLFSIAEETSRLRAIHGATTVVCTASCEPRIRRFTKFDNAIRVFAFRDLIDLFPATSQILVHVPEAFAGSYIADSAEFYRRRPDIQWRFNILLQNIDLIPSRNVVAEIRQIGAVTATTAHAAYGTSRTADILGCPVHHLSTFVSPRLYERTPFAEKEKLIIISPDEHSCKAAIVEQMRQSLPDHRIVEIRNMSYRTYLRTTERAKFAFTFGEGLDGYFIETVFFGGVAMAIFNDRFFEQQYAELEGVFADTDSALSSVAQFLRDADDARTFARIAASQFAIAARNYIYEEYIANLRAYYERHFPAA
jgi:hypothetical protein